MAKAQAAELTEAEKEVVSLRKQVEVAKKKIAELEANKPKLNIFESITRIMDELGAIGKDKFNDQQKFKYRGVDDVMNALNPLFAKYNVFVVPRVTSHHREERTSQKGNLLLYSIVHMDYTFYAEDGSSIVATVVGEGMDSADKSTNKAMAIAFKYACFQVFCIPTEETAPDPDKTVHDLAPDKKEPDTDSIGKMFIDKNMQDSLKQKLDAKGVPFSEVTRMFGAEEISVLMISDFTKAMNLLEKMPDKKPAPKPVDDKPRRVEGL